MALCNSLAFGGLRCLLNDPHHYADRQDDQPGPNGQHDPEHFRLPSPSNARHTFGSPTVTCFARVAVSSSIARSSHDVRVL
jgi:hypothetical protein